MPKPIVNGLNEVLTAQNSILINDQALANAGDLVSSEAVIGQCSGGVQLNLIAESTATLTGTITGVVEASATSGGSFSEIGRFLVPASTAIVEGKTIESWAFPREYKDKLYVKVTLTTSADDSGKSVSLVTAWIPKGL